MERLQAWAAEGLVAEEDGHLVVTRWGRYFLRSLCAEFDAYLPSEPVTRFSQAV
jgi:coproporphyrinogen III oxidase-like Fe-S oxidoreductase